MNTFLNKILKAKQKEIEANKKIDGDLIWKEGHRRNTEELMTGKETKLFSKRIRNPQMGDISVIAEVKIKSPSVGKLGSKKDVVQKVKEYQSGYADAISIVTDKAHFGGNIKLLADVRKITPLPILQKDFFIEEYQIAQAKGYGANAILLIGKLEQYWDQDFFDFIKILNLEIVYEIYDEKDLESKFISFADVIGVNARNLETFEVDVEKACRLISRISKEHTVVGFSGIKSRTEVEMYKQAGAKAVLVGTEAMKSKSASAFIRKLKGI